MSTAHVKAVPEAWRQVFDGVDVALAVRGLDEDHARSLERIRHCASLLATEHPRLQPVD